LSLLRSPHASTQSSAVYPQYTGIQLPTSANSLPIPIVYGLSKLGLNIIYYANFLTWPIYQAQQKAGKGGGIFGGGGGGSTQLQIVGYYYTADLQMALCEGPITGIGQVFVGQSQYIYGFGSPNPLGLTLPIWPQVTSLFTGTSTQAAWSYLGSGGNPLSSSAIPYRGVAYLAAALFNLGESASVGSLQFEVAGRFYGTGANGIDADPALVIQDFLTNPQYGAGFPAEELDAATLLGASGDSSTQTYCRALSLCFSPQVVQQEPANTILTRWMQLLNLGPFFSGGLLKIVPYGDMNIFGVDGTQWVAPIVPVAYLDDNVFIYKDGEDPVLIDRVDPFALPTVQPVEVLNRAGVNVSTALVVEQVNDQIAALTALAGRGGGGSLPQPQGQPQYNPTPVYARDLAASQSIGLRVASTITAHEICDLNVASIIAQIALQRALYIRKTYKFTLDWRYCLLDPMDIVALTDPDLGLNQELVRITEIHEKDDGTLDFIAEQFTQGVSTPGVNITSGTNTGAANAAVPAEPVNSVLIYEPPLAASNGVAQIWLGASGGIGGVPDPNWGGAYVWASLDGSSYSQIGRIDGAMPSGVLSANFPNASGWDTGHALSVNLSQSGQPLSSTSAINAQAGAANLALLGGSNGELVAFETATLTGANAYNLTNIQRGLYGTTPAAWATGSAFSQLSNIAHMDLPAQYVGRTIYFKFQSFNRYGGGVQDLSTCAVFTYSASGNGYQESNPSTTVSASGASVIVPLTLPANSYITNVTVKNLTAVSGPTLYNVDPQYTPLGAAGPTSGTWGNNGVGNGATNSMPMSNQLWSAPTELVLTPIGGSFSGGTVQVSITYITI
jgi:hypothetical protein